MKKLITLITFCCLSLPAAGQSYLAPLANGYGPFDYSDPVMRQTKLEVVEKYHLDEGILSLSKGMNSSVWADLNYTLRAFPNHHYALEAVARLLRMQDQRMSNYLRSERYRGMPPEVNAEAYFKRAIEFAPHDGVVRLLFGIHLHKTDRVKEAVAQYEKAIEQGLESADLEYNIGLAYFDLEQYDKAAEHARKAYSLSHPLPGLRKKLKRVGKWPPPPAKL